MSAGFVGASSFAWIRLPSQESEVEHQRPRQRGHRDRRAAREHDRRQQRRHQHQRACQHTIGDNNVAVGRSALFATTSGNANVAIGAQAGKNVTTGSNNIDLANAGKAGEVGTIRIGNPSKQTATFIAGITGTNVGGTAQPVVVNSNGKLGTAPALAATVKRLAAETARQQRQLEELRGQLERLTD